jgi:hypothetical protein
LRTVIELDDEVSLFFPGRAVSVVDRAWVAEHPARLHCASRRRWRRLANAPAREPTAAAQARLAALATRTHRLSRALADGDLPRLKGLFALGLDLTARLRGYGFEATGGTALHAACVAKQPAVVAWMLHRGADPTARDDLGRSAADLVASLFPRDDRFAAVAALLDARAAAAVHKELPAARGGERARSVTPLALVPAVAKALAVSKLRVKKSAPAAAAASHLALHPVTAKSHGGRRVDRNGGKGNTGSGGRGGGSRFRGHASVDWFRQTQAERRARDDRKEANEADRRAKRQALHQCFAHATFLAPVSSRP